MSYNDIRYTQFHSLFAPINPHNRYWSNQIHSHTTEELLLIVSEGVCTIDSNGSTCQVPTPAFIWNRAGSYHLVSDVAKCDRRSYMASFLPNFLAKIPEELRFTEFMEDYGMFALPLNEKHLKVLESMFSLLITVPTPQRQLMLPCIFHNITLFLKAGAEPICVSRRYGYIFEVLSLIEKSVSEKFSSVDLATRFNVSRSKLEADFKQATGQTIHAYRKTLQLQSARLLLATTQKSQTEIATNCGFADESHMIRAFRQRYGITPKAFREERKQDPRWTK